MFHGYLSTSININQHLSIFININQHLSIFINIYQHLSTIDTRKQYFWGCNSVKSHVLDHWFNTKGLGSKMDICTEIFLVGFHCQVFVPESAWKLNWNPQLRRHGLWIDDFHPPKWGTFAMISSAFVFFSYHSYYYHYYHYYHCSFLVLLIYTYNWTTNLWTYILSIWFSHPGSVIYGFVPHSGSRAATLPCSGIYGRGRERQLCQWS